MSKFSVIIPIFNIDIIYLKQCLDSVYKQTYQDFECLLVNDCSTNLDTITFLQSVNKQYPKLDIKLINNHVNLGLGPSRNVGINNTTGQFILFLDSDDYLEIEALNLINQYLSQHSYNLDILSFSTNWLVDNQLVKLTQVYKEWMPYVVTNININHNIFRDKSTSWSKVYARDFIVRNNFRFLNDKAYGEDLYFHIITYSKAKKIFVIDEALYNYRRNTPNSLSVNYDQKNKILHSLSYAYRAYDVIKNDDSNLSRHYAIFFKFLFETNMGGSLEEFHKLPWWKEVYDKFDGYYQELLTKTNSK